MTSRRQPQDLPVRPIEEILEELASKVPPEEWKIYYQAEEANQLLAEVDGLLSQWLDNERNHVFQNSILQQITREILFELGNRCPWCIGKHEGTSRICQRHASMLREEAGPAAAEGVGEG